MKFTPKTDEQIQQDRLLPDGVYDFEVMSAEDATSKTGKDMIALTLRVFLPSGSAIQLKDWLLADDTMAWKLKKFCETIGMLEQYESGQFYAEDLDGRAGKVRIGSKTDPEFGPQNRVVGYGEASRKAKAEPHPSAMGGQKKPPKPAPQVNDVATDDDIPF